jgi:AhpD family alkylhydroperoxidase
MVNRQSARMTSAQVKKAMPALYESASALSAAVRTCGLELELIELVYLRVSQINGCAYCIDIHAAKLTELGVPASRQILVSAWEEAGIFSEREAAALKWAEVVTLLSIDHVPDEAWEAVAAVFSHEEIVQLIAAIGVINLWNRIAVSFRYPPGV